MKLDKSTLLMYAVTDRSWLRGRTLCEQVEDCLRGGATIIQLREKEMDYDAFLAEALEIKSLCAKYGVPFIINDNVDIAIACNADGVHIGQSDTGAIDALTRIGNGKILGVSAQTVAQAVAAQADGADYLGVGAVFSTGTKRDADDVSLGALREICAAVSIPVVAIGGISRHNVPELRGTGIAGVAVVSAIFAQPDITAATAELVELTRGCLI